MEGARKGKQGLRRKREGKGGRGRLEGKKSMGESLDNVFYLWAQINSSARALAFAVAFAKLEHGQVKGHACKLKVG